MAGMKFTYEQKLQNSRNVSAIFNLMFKILLPEECLLFLKEVDKI